MKCQHLLVLLGLVWAVSAGGVETGLDAKLKGAMGRHLGLLLGADGAVKELKGKTGDGEEALAFYLMYEVTKDERYRRAGVALAERVLADMRATKLGVLMIKDKEKPDGRKISGGGPPPFGHYCSSAGYILWREGRTADLKYLAECVDRFAWNEGGWWAADVDVNTGESKAPLTKPTPINKCAAMCMAAGALSEFVRKSEPGLSASLQRKTAKCVYEKIIPAQETDGFWHYSLSDKDPKDKDILGYFMLTTRVLMQLQHYNPMYKEAKLEAALKKAQEFAEKCIAPMTDPNAGLACTAYGTPSTPKHYALAEEPKRGFELGLILLTSGRTAEGTKIFEESMKYFPYGNAGQDGVHAAAPTAMWLNWAARGN